MDLSAFLDLPGLVLQIALARFTVGGMMGDHSIRHRDLLESMPLPRDTQRVSQKGEKTPKN
jgi:hypothetical protein